MWTRRKSLHRKHVYYQAFYQWNWWPGWGLLRSGGRLPCIAGHLWHGYGVLKMQSFNAVEPVTRGAPLTQRCVFRLHFHGQDGTPWSMLRFHCPGPKRSNLSQDFLGRLGGTSRNLRTTGIHWGRWYPTDPSMKTIRWDLHPAQVDVLVLNVSWQPADLAFLNGPQTGIRGIHRSKLGTLIIRWLIRTKHILKSVVP